MTTVARSNSLQEQPTKLRPRFHHLIVATAADEASRGSIHLAVELARRDGATVTAVGVLPPEAASPLSPLVPDESARRHLLESVRTWVGGIRGTETWAKRVAFGITSTVLAQLAGDMPGTLILLGLGHYGRVDRLFRGETTIDVIRHANHPVLLVAPTATSLPRRIVAAVDFTPASLAAARLASTLAPPDGTLTLAHVCAFGDAEPQPGDLASVYRAGVHANLEEATRGLRRQTDIAVDSVILHGEVAPALLEYAERVSCELIALGGHEHGFIDRILLGSVRTRVVRGAQSSVLVVPPRHERPVATAGA
jgi:nucleotide-binding universal stress UspA family protein